MCQVRAEIVRVGARHRDALMLAVGKQCDVPVGGGPGLAGKGACVGVAREVSRGVRAAVLPPAPGAESR